MSARISFGVVVACIALGGCVTAQRPPEPQMFASARYSGKKCVDEATKCEAKVSITCSSAGCGIAVDPDVLLIGDKKKVKITWALADPAYTFDPALGIVVNDIPPGEFGCGPKGNDGKTFECTNKHSQFGVYKYIVNLVGPNASRLTLDPMVIND